jgi:hypothetical protein
MGVWLLFPFIFLVSGVIYALWRRTKQLQQELLSHASQIQLKDTELSAKDTELYQKTHQIEQVQQENAMLEAKYLKKFKSLEERKANLEKYHKKHQEVRQGMKKSIEAAIENHDKWVPHARESTNGKPLGKPKGAAGGGRVRPEVVDKAIHLIPEKCPHCGAVLCDRTACVSHTHVITDLENLQLPGHEYKALTLMNSMLVIYRRKCPYCKVWVYPDSGPLKYLRYGLNFVCYVISKRIDTRMPFEILIDELCTQFGAALTLSATAIIDWFKRHETLLTDLYEQLKKIVQLLEHVHIDETGLPMNGKNWWTWVICNENFVWYWQSYTRGHTAIDQILADFEGVIVSDCWGAYNKLDKEQQKCLAHLITELKEILYRLGKESEQIEGMVSQQEPLQNDAADISTDQESPQDVSVTRSPPRKRGRPKKQIEQLPSEEFTRLKSYLDSKGKTMEQAKRLKDFIDESWGEGPRGWKTPLDKRCSKQAAEQEFLQMIQTLRDEKITDPRLNRVVDRAAKYGKQLFTYLDHEGVEPDNNAAERDLRGMVVQRKVSGSFKNPLVSEMYHLLKSLSVTCRKNEKDFQELHLRLLAGEKIDLTEYFFD